MTIQLTTSRLLLRFPILTDDIALKNLEEQNKEHWERWESTLSKPSSIQLDVYQTQLKHWILEIEEGKSVRFLMFKKDNLQEIIGLCNFTQIFYGAFQACYLGYKISKQHERKGLMKEALACSLQYMFEELHLHRIMANFIPSNKRSAKLLEKLGFTIEGYAKRYLLINNKWEDHITTALSYENWKELACSHTVYYPSKNNLEELIKFCES